MANIITKPYTVATNPNLLDNWYFVGGGICQRRETSHTGTGYWLDRWFGGNNYGSASISNSGLTVTGANNWHIQCQKIENGAALLADKTVTVSALLGNNMLIKGTVKVTLTSTGRNILALPIQSAGETIGYLCLYGSTDNVQVQLRAQAGESVTFKAVKLELGDCQTLAHYVQDSGNSFHFEVNEVPSYEQELAKCQRYLVVWKPQANTYLGFGAVISSGTIGVHVTLPVSMRSGGTATIVGTAPSAWKNANNGQYTITGATIQSLCGNLLSLLLTTSTATTTGDGVRVTVLGDSTFGISKEL